MQLLSGLRWGRVAGLAMIVSGVLLYLVVWWLVSSDLDRPDFNRWVAAPAILPGWGLGLVLAPGGQVTVGDVMADRDRRLEMTAGAPWYHYVVWLVTTFGAVTLGFNHLASIY